MSRYGRDSNGGGSLGIYIVLAIVGCFVYSCCNSNERQATTDVANNAPVPDDGYYDEDGNYIENDSSLYEPSEAVLVLIIESLHTFTLSSSSVSRELFSL